MGKSLLEKNLVKDAKKIIEKSINLNNNIILPVDVFCSNSIMDVKKIKCVDVKNILPNQMALDIGSKTIKLIESSILQSKSILWNGPLGVFEYKPFDPSPYP